MDNIKRVVRQIQKRIAADFEISEEELLSHNRARGYSYPRMLSMHIIREVTGLSYPHVAQFFEVHHTSILHASRWVMTSAVVREHYREYIEDMVKEFKDAST